MEPSDAPAPPRWGRWALAVTLSLFVVRFLLRSPLIALTPEECHTGGIARELLAHGVQFPLLSYTPEFYENGIILEGFLAVPFVAALGPTLLALKLLSLAVSVLVTLLGLALLRRVLDQVRIAEAAQRRTAEVAYLIVSLFSPARALFEAMDALGDENEATAMTLLVLVLFFRRIERPSAGRVAALWTAAGVCLFFHKGTLLATALAGAYELLSLLRRRTPPRLLAVAAACAAVGLLPAFLASRRSAHEDASTILTKFPLRNPLEMLLGLAQSLWIFADQRLVTVLLFAAALGWFLARLRRSWSPESPVVWLCAYQFLHLALMAAAFEHQDYFYYGFPTLALPLAVLTSQASRSPWLLQRLRPPAAAAAALASLALLTLPSLRPDLRTPLRLARDQGGACSWRFGRAFVNAFQRDDWRVVEACRRLGGDASLDCISGFAFDQEHARPPPLRPDERLAFAFGAGRRLVRSSQGEPPCGGYPAEDERRACSLGALAECLSYSDLMSRAPQATLLPQPGCDLSGLPLRGFAQPLFDRLAARPSQPQVPVFDGGFSGCQPVLRQCYASVRSFP